MARFFNPMKANAEAEATLSQEELKRQLHYDPKSGVFSWKVSRKGVQVDSPAGNADSKKAIRITINYQKYGAHRLAWLYMTGEWPPELVDHINGEPYDNRWENLRLANYCQNNRNRRISSLNTSGVKGVYWHKIARKWEARLRIPSGKKINVGTFPTIEEARDALQAARLEHHGEFANHG